MFALSSFSVRTWLFIHTYIHLILSWLQNYKLGILGCFSLWKTLRKLSFTLPSPVSSLCFEHHVTYSSHKEKESPMHLYHMRPPARSPSLPTPSLYMCVYVVPPPPHTPTHIHPCLSFRLSSLFPCIYLLVCPTVSLSCWSIQTALLIQGQSVFSLGWCQTLERWVLWKFNLDSSPNHIAVMLSIWPPVCRLNIRSLTLSITFDLKTYSF